MARTERVPQVTEATAALLRGLWSRAEQGDGVAPVSEAFRLAVGPSPRPGVLHLLRDAGDGTLVGYAQVSGAGTSDAVAEPSTTAGSSASSASTRRARLPSAPVTCTRARAGQAVPATALFTAFPGHAGRCWPLSRWRSLARIGGRGCCSMTRLRR